MKDKIYIHTALGLMVANSTPTSAPNEEEYLRKAPILDWVRGLFQNLDDADRRDALGFFPELAEGEDERIRKALVKYFQEKKNCVGDTWAGMKVDDVLAYLERKKEQKPAEWSEEDKAMMRGILERGCSQIPPREFALTSKQTGWLQELTNRFTPQPRQSWSKEDKEKLNKLYTILPQCVECMPRIIGDKECVELQDFLAKILELKSH